VIELQITLADRLRIAGHAIRGVFKQPTPQDLLGVYARSLSRRTPDRRRPAG
jgi:hypothetical protein